MSDSRSRFEKWVRSTEYYEGALWHVDMGKPESPYVYMETQWQAWQAAEAETARRCAELAGDLADEYRAKYKGTPGPDGIRRGGSYDPHDDGMSDGAAVVEDAIRTEFSEAWK